MLETQEVCHFCHYFMNEKERNRIGKERDGLVDLVLFLMKMNNKYDTKLNTEMIVLNRGGEEIRL